MFGRKRNVLLYIKTLVALGCFLVTGQVFAAASIKGQVLGGGAPIAGSTDTLWAASAAEPKQLAQT
jgi:hypothetical protein